MSVTDQEAMAHAAVIKGMTNRMLVGDRNNPAVNPPFEAPVASGTSTGDITAVFRLSEIGETGLIIPEVPLVELVATVEVRGTTSYLVVSGVLVLTAEQLGSLVVGGTYDYVIWVLQAGNPVGLMAYGEIVVFDVTA
jgi:hypothetical protein